MKNTYNVYCVINSNEEGYNLLGIFDTEEAAKKAAHEYNENGRASVRDIFAGDLEEDMQYHLDFYDSWDSAKVVIHQMNSMIKFF